MQPHPENTRRFLVVLILAVVVTRLPLLPLGYGSDGDGWRVAWSASTLWHSGNYQPSRFPGFPVYEILSAPFIGIGGPLLSNAATLLAFMITILLFRMLLREWEIPSANILVATFAFLPILWKNSTVTMDYLWGLLCVVAAFLLGARKRYLIGAAMIGLAAGTRVTHILFLLPLAYLVGDSAWVRTVARMAVVAAAVTLGCYLPVLLRPELMHDLAAYLADIRTFSLSQRIGFFVYRAVYSLGLAGVLAIGVFGIASWKIWRNALRTNDRRFVASLLGVSLMLALFFLLADEREYLIPALPFLLVMLGMTFRPRVLGIVALLLLSEAFVSLDVVSHDFGHQRLSIHLAPGMLVQDTETRIEQGKLRESLGRYPPDDSSIVMTAQGPVLWVGNPGILYAKDLETAFDEPEVARSALHEHTYFIYSLPRPTCLRLRQEGYRVYYLEGTKDYLESFLRYDLDSAGVLPFHPRGM